MKVGIDLGTTFSAIAYVNSSGNPVIIKNEFDNETTPSVIAFDNDGIHIGEEAKNLQLAGLDSVISSFKRYMGDSSYFFEYNSHKYSATELSSILLKGMKEVAEKRTGERIDQAIITVPAYFNDLQKNATMEAGRKAGLNVRMLIHEPTAASIYYGFKNNVNKTVMTFDLGGGTFDITILKINNGDISVVGTKGDSNLGGKDWDYAITDIIAEQFEDEFGFDPKNDEAFNSRYSVESENIKKKLSLQPTIRESVEVDGKKMTAVITREDFESRTEYNVDSTINICELLLDDLNMKWSDLDDIILVGGSTRLPSIRKKIKEVSKVNVIINEDTDVAVSKGAALFTQSENGVISLSSKRPAAAQGKPVLGVPCLKIKDVIAHSLGALAEDSTGTKYVNDIILKRGSQIPCTEKRQFEIKKYNRTDKIEIYTMQGESKYPLDCTVLALVTAEGIINDGNGLMIDVEYSYDESGMVDVKAFQSGRALTIIKKDVPTDISWMGQKIERKEVIIPDIYVIFAVDLSGSMYARDSRGETARHNAVCACKNFVSNLPNAKFTVIGYSDRERTLCTWEDSNSVISYIDRLENEDLGGGNEAHAFRTIRKITSEIVNKAKVYAITLTDGQWYINKLTYGEPISSARDCIRSGVECISVGFGHADYDFLKKISSTDESALMSSQETLAETFSTIATSIGANDGSTSTAINFKR